MYRMTAQKTSNKAEVWHNIAYDTTQWCLISDPEKNGGGKKWCRGVTAQRPAFNMFLLGTFDPATSVTKHGANIK